MPLVVSKYLNPGTTVDPLFRENVQISSERMMSRQKNGSTEHPKQTNEVRPAVKVPGTEYVHLQGSESVISVRLRHEILLGLGLEII